ncbi:methyltransferase domain-containing protein [Patulibacter americanus]|uniref:methyltransferase domain-containing protein n=1 Tax=Patulibacter americanus TaxID=588672 RepID=UPI0003B3D9AD|nr:methyltransferase domain-containing protein [Patulibacter americanus]
MAQPITREFLSDVLAVVPTPDPVVAFGVLQAEPDPDGDLRRFFPGRPFVGTDLRPGPGVDRVEDLQALRIADGRVGTAVCLDTLEHCADPVTAVRELHRVLRPRGGVCLLSCGVRFGTPGRSDDRLRFTPEGFRGLLAPFDDVWVQGVGDPGNPSRAFAVGIRGGSLDVLRERGLPRLQADQRAWEQTRGAVRVGPVRHPPRQLARELGREGIRRLHRRLHRRLRGRR